MSGRPSFPYCSQLLQLLCGAGTFGSDNWHQSQGPQRVSSHTSNDHSQWVWWQQFNQRGIRERGWVFFGSEQVQWLCDWLERQNIVIKKMPKKGSLLRTKSLIQRHSALLKIRTPLETVHISLTSHIRTFAPVVGYTPPMHVYTSKCFQITLNLHTKIPKIVSWLKKCLMFNV